MTARLFKRQKDLTKLAMAEKLNRLNYYAGQLQESLDDCEGNEHRLRQDGAVLVDIANAILSNATTIEAYKKY